MKTTRRDFLKHGLGATTLLASGATFPLFLGKSAHALSRTPEDERILVVVQLSGGNDGLNTIIPYRDDAYRKARPTIAIPESQVLRLDDDLGLHPELAGLKRLYDEGQLGVIGNVGYPNPDRSHFRSMDIWHTASVEPERAQTGWLGRFADAAGHAHGGKAARDDIRPPAALHLDDTSLPLALAARESSIPSIRDIESFRLRGATSEMREALAVSRPGASDDLDFVQRLAVESCRNADRIDAVADRGAKRGAYPNHPLGQRLRQVATLIGADFGPRLYYTSIGGFDTHSRQALVHGPLLRALGDSIAAFYDDLRARGLQDRVLMVTFSEFGRRVAENGSLGTDHGAAAPMFVVGPRCRPGLHGERPDLENLDSGDVRHDVDFRSVYASVLRDGLGADPKAILGASYPKLDVVRRG